MKSAQKSVFLGLLFIILFASLQFILILRHKSTYVSDSYFYKHLFYQYKGYSFDEAYALIQSEIDLTGKDKIERNIFENKKQYQDSYSFFKKRPLYPLTATIFDTFLKNHYLAFLLPVFVAYTGTIIVTFYFFRKRFNIFLATLGALLFISFYPFLDWSTYFLTDTIGTFFWMLQLLFIYKFIISKNYKWGWAFLITVVISLFNREQSLLMLPVLSLLAILLGNRRILGLVLPLVAIFTLYIFISILTGQRSILDTIVITMNSYGLYDKTYNFGQIRNYLVSSYVISHVAFIRDLVSHHWWFAISFFALIGVAVNFRRSIPLDLIMIASAIGSYLAIFVYPVLSYRFFFPVVVSIIYFFLIFLMKVFAKSDVWQNP